MVCLRLSASLMESLELNMVIEIDLVKKGTMGQLSTETQALTYISCSLSLQLPFFSKQHLAQTYVLDSQVMDTKNSQIFAV